MGRQRVMWTSVRRVDRSMRVVAALLDYRQCPAEEYALEHIFPPVVSACDFTRIKEDRWFGELRRRRGRRQVVASWIRLQHQHIR